MEWKKVIQILKESLPRSVGVNECKSRSMFENINQFLTIRPRAKTWLKIKIAANCLEQEFLSLKINAKKLGRKIEKLLKPKSYQEGVRHGLNWELQMRRKPNKTQIEYA